MKTKTLFGKLALGGCTFIAAVTIGRAQTITDIGTAPPAIGPNDLSQLLFQQGNPQPPGLNYYFDANPPVGSTFTTPGNPGGYIMNAWAIKTAGGGGGGGPTTAQTYTLRVFSVSGTTATLVATITSQNAVTFTELDWLQMTDFSVPLAPNTTYAYTLHRNSAGWEQLSWTNGLVGTTSRACRISNGGGSGSVTYCTDTTASGTFDIGLVLPTALAVGVPVASAANPVLLGNTVTLTPGAIVDNAGNGTYTYQWLTDGGGGGVLTNIPGATASTYNFNTTGISLTNLGAYKFAVQVTDSVSASATSASLTVDVALQQAGVLTINTNTPAPGASDAFQFNQPPSGTAHVSGNLNYYTDNGVNNGVYMGETFTTGGNPQGYSLGSVSLKLDGNPGPGAPGYGYGTATATNITYTVFLYSISTDQSAATLLGIVTNYTPGISISNYPTWVTVTLPTPLQLNSNAMYGFAFGRSSGNFNNGSVYFSMETSDGTQDWYPSGQMAGFPAAGGTISYPTTSGLDGTFDVELDPFGVAFIVKTPVAAPDPTYGLSQVSLTASVKTPGTYTYQWLTDDGTGATPPHYITLTGLTAPNVTVQVQDFGFDQPTNFYFVATRTTDSISVTSTPVVVTIHAAHGPVLTDPTPASVVTFAGGSQTWIAGEVGTTPITNQWWADLGSGYVPLTGRTNNTLILSNVQTTDSGNYIMGATNMFGPGSAAVTTPVSLTVLADPSAPNPATQIYANMVATNKVWAYWRLNETSNPGSATTYAYDYSGHGFWPVYGSAVTVNNAGPVPPSFPGMDPGEISAGTTVALPNSSLTVPNLNLTGRSNITFMAWINPGGSQLANAGLLVHRNGADVSGFGYANNPNDLGYIWNQDSPATYNWDSGLAPVPGQWNFVAYVLTPTNTTVYLGNLDGGTNFYMSVNPVGNIAESFNGGTTWLGGDPTSVNRNFNGSICEVSLFTNAFTTLQVQQNFQAAIGASSLPPTVGLTVTPSAASSPGVYSGQNVFLSVGGGSGTMPITNQWQSSPDGSTWSSVAGGTNSSLLINPQVMGTFQYRMVAANIAATVTSTPVTVTFNALPATPPGLWTENFEYTNNIVAPNSQSVSGGLGSYVGRGILGNGTFWNMVPDVRSSGSVWNGLNVFSSSSLADDGLTQVGVVCEFQNGGAYNGFGVLPTRYDPMNLTEQWFRGYGEQAYPGQYNGGQGTLHLSQVPAGTYNVVCYGGAGQTTQGSQSYGSQFIVEDSLNGYQTNFTAIGATPVTSLQQGVNFVVFTNVHSYGTLDISVMTNNATAPSDSWGTVSAVQIQLVSYDPPMAAFTGTPTNAVVGQSVAFANTTIGNVTNAVWTFGDGASVTNTSNATVYHQYAATGTYTVGLTVSGLGGGPSSTNQTAYITVYPALHLSNARYSGGSFGFAGANGPVGQQYRVLTSTNVALPFANWTPVWTNIVAPDGTYGYTNSSPAGGASFYRVVSP